MAAFVANVVRHRILPQPSICGSFIGSFPAMVRMRTEIFIGCRIDVSVWYGTSKKVGPCPRFGSIAGLFSARIEGLSAPQRKCGAE